jgi:hypothetical protein
MRLGQAAFEYLLLAGVAMMLIVPGAMLFYTYSLRSGDELVRSKIHLIGNELADTVEKVYYIGESSWETVKMELPENVNWIYILDNSEIVIGYDTYVGITEAVFFSDIPLNASYNGSMPNQRFLGPQMHTGLTIVKVTSMGSYVLINETK